MAELKESIPKEELYKDLPDSTRVWIYQANRPFEEKDIPEIKKKVSAFVESWVSHSRQLRALGDVLYNRFVILMVDESQAGASGCSIDSSVYFLKQLQAEYRVDLFDRMNFTYLNGEEAVTVPRDVFQELYEKKEINDQTLVFDTLVNTKGDFVRGWVKPLGESWHQRLVG